MATSQGFDYIVVGGGTAGLVVANGLSADPDVTVLVLEAGEDNLNDPRSSTPALWQTMLGSDLDWNYTTTPQPGLNGRAIGQPQGRALGGSSAINGLAFIPPSASGIDAWGKLGNKDWNWETLKPYYLKSRNITYPSNKTSHHLGLDKFEHTDAGHGPVKASFFGTVDDPLAPAWVQSFEALGWGVSADPFSGEVTGGFTCASSINPDNATRSHSGTAFYLPAKNRPNLHLQTSASVHKIVLDKKHGEVVARGVQWTKGDKTHTTHASKEVILAAGAYGTPKLLELSGIGSPEVLEKMGIEVLVASPSVGKNLQDHLMTGISFEVKDGVPTLDDLRRKVPEVLQDAMARYQANHTGPLSIGGIGSFAVMPVPQFQTAPGKAELERLLAENPPTTNGEQPVEQEYYDFVKSTLSESKDGPGAFWLAPALGSFGNNSAPASRLVSSNSEANYITIGFTHVHPFSRGSSHISGPDPKLKPTINTNYFQHALDEEIFARYLMFIEQLAQTPPMSDLIKDPTSGRRNSPFATAKTLDEARMYAKTGTISNWHPVGTCCMLPREKGGVVGADLRVHGVHKGLRIVDSSIMPIITRGNPQTTVYAVAERAVDIIRGC